MGDIFERQRRSGNRERAEILKAKVGCEDAVVALGLDSDLGDICPNPQCGACGAMKYSGDSQTYRCGACDEAGDIVAMVRMTRGCGFFAALDFLEEACLPRADDKTGRLL
jgi:hypothetical protein